MEEHLQRHREALNLIRAQCAVGTDPVEATKAVVEEFGRDALRASMEESDRDTVHNLVGVLIHDFNADPIFSLKLAVDLFGRASIQDFIDAWQADQNRIDEEQASRDSRRLGGTR